MDFSGQKVSIVLNPAPSGTSYNNGVLTFTDQAGNTQHVACPAPVQQGTSGWWTCFPHQCIP